MFVRQHPDPKPDRWQSGCFVRGEPLDRLRPIGDHRHGHPFGLAVVPGRGQCPDPDAARLPVGVPERQGRLPAARWRLRGRHGRPSSPSGDVPDVFYVDAGYAQQWIDQGYLAPLDDYIAKSNFDTSQFFPGYASIFKGTDGKVYGLPKDGNTIAMAYNTALVPTPPKTMDELVTLAKSLKGKDGLKAPLCLSSGLDRGLAFLYAQGGSLLSDDGKTERSTPTPRRRPSSGTWTCSRTVSG